MFRAAFQAASRASAAGRRTFATAAPGQTSANEFEATRAAVAEHAKHSAELWRKITC
ncbi:hypothetical protein JCM11641_001400, partial [Rhodosporidiobolus odoratus]